MPTSTIAYNKAAIYHALETVTPEQLNALAQFFSNLAPQKEDMWDTMTDEEYTECLEIAMDRSPENWTDFKGIG